MKEDFFTLDMIDYESSFNLKEQIYKYLKYWPWFLGSLVLCVLLGLVYLRYPPESYASMAKIKIIDESKEMNVASDALSMLNGGVSQINMDNEIEVLRSYRLLDKVA